MPSLGHRLAVYFGLRDDPVLLAQWEETSPDLVLRAVGFFVAAVISLTLASGVVLLVRAIAGGDTGAGPVLWGAVQVLAAVGCAASAFALLAAGRRRSRRR